MKVALLLHKFVPSPSSFCSVYLFAPPFPFGLELVILSEVAGLYSACCECYLIKNVTVSEHLLASPLFSLLPPRVTILHLLPASPMKSNSTLCSWFHVLLAALAVKVMVTSVIS